MMVQPSVGWGVLHLFFRVDRERAERDPQSVKYLRDALSALCADDHQAVAFATLGHKADFGVMALGPDLARLQRFQHELAAAPVTLSWSYLSLTELSPDFLPAVPLDPFDGKPLRYQQLLDGVVIHSVGTNPAKISHPGLPDGIDIGFRLWNPEARRQPAPPEPKDDNDP